MRTLLFIALLAFAPAAQARTLDELGWLAGCWRAETARSVVTEVWLAPPMPAMLGYSYTQRAGETVAWEQTRIAMIDDVPHFIAMPNGGAAVSFRLRENDAAQTATFENPAHDFPQVVAYARDGDALTATISTIDGGDPIVFSYQRIACEATP